MGGVVTAAEIPWQDTVDVLDVAAFLEAARPAWHAHANCRGMTDAMFPKSRAGVPSHVLWTEAVAVCAACTVIDECRQAGQDEAYGVWGGDVKQPRRLRTVTVGDCLRDGNWWRLSDLVYATESNDDQVRSQLRSLRTRRWLIESRLRHGWIEYRKVT